MVAGALFGIVLRLVYSGKPGGAYAAMSGGFIYFAPFLVGAVTVFVAERKQRREWGYYTLAPLIANGLFVLGTMAMLIEGLICAVIIVPLFAVLGIFGGLLMGAVCRFTNWPKHTISSIGLLPLVLGLVETGGPLPERTGIVERSIVIEAAPDEIWNQIVNVTRIEPQEIDDAWLFQIGVPLPRDGLLDERNGERLRRVTMGKQVYFDEVITDFWEPRYLRWTYRYYPDSFPPHALDEHVVLGGHYFDINDTIYTLTPRGGETELKLTMHYRVSTQFNWYAEPVANFLLGNLAAVNLEYYRRSSEGPSPAD